MLLLVTWMIVPGSDVRAQFRLVHVPDRLHTEQTVNFYLDVEGSARFDGAYLAIPTNWTLDHVTVITDNGRSSNVPFRTVEGTKNRFLLLPSRRLSRDDRLILRIKTGNLSGPYAIRITPIQKEGSPFENRTKLLDALTLRQRVRIDERRQAPDNRVLEIDMKNAKPFPVSHTDLSSLPSFTTEFWMKSAASNALILSTWDGDEHTAYPLELLIDGSGHIVFFRGVRGEHRSMRSAKPVADGAWHHVAISHDKDAQWSRMFIDGVASDSLYHVNALLIPTAGSIMFGGRAQQADEVAKEDREFVGLIDEIRIWHSARDASAIRQSMRQPIVSNDGVVEVIAFDESDPIPFQIEEFESARFVRSNLSFYEPIRDLEATLDVASVLLEWTVSDPDAEAFLVERSRDGTNYDVLDRVERRNQSTFDPTSEVLRYRDVSIPAGVAFYRIRQQFIDGMETVSRALKIGMGADDDDASAVLTGNFPNPFNPTTTVTYMLREAQHVHVSVWDLAGQMVSLLVDAEEEAGEHHVQFDATDLPSGTYFVRMRSAEGIRSHQMILMK